MEQDRSTLLCPPVVRWTARRKEALIVTINEGEITAQRACDIHEISHEELAEWEQRYMIGGVNALRTTRTQIIVRELRQGKTRKRREIVVK